MSFANGDNIESIAVITWMVERPSQHTTRVYCRLPNILLTSRSATSVNKAKTSHNLFITS